MRVELYTPRSPSVVDLTPWTRSVSWTDAQSGPPHQACQVAAKWTTYTPPVQNGDWLVVRLADGAPAVFWGMAITGSTGIAPGMEGNWTINAIGWFDVLAKADLIVSMFIGPEDEVGTLFTALAGSKIAGPGVGPAQRGFLNGLIGEGWASAAAALGSFLRRVSLIELPTSLGGGTIGSSIGVIYDQATAEAYAGSGTAERKGQRGRRVESIPGGVNLSDIQPLLFGSAKVAGFAQGTWGIDPVLGEMFPSLEDFGTLADNNSSDDPTMAELWRAAAKSSGAGTPDSSPLRYSRGRNSPDDPAVPVPPPQAATVGGIAGVGQKIGRNPVLIYRMRPWRATPIMQWANRLATQDPRFAPIQSAVKRVSAAAGSPFDAITWDPSRAVRLSSSDGARLNLSNDDGALASIFTIPWPGTDGPPVWWRNIGLPFIDSKAARQFGARQYSFTWPFFRSFQGVDGPTESTLADTAVLIAAQGTQFAIRSTRFQGGTIECASFRPDVRIGEPVAYRTDEGPTLTGYVESTTNTVEIAGDGSGQIRRARTSLTVSRALWDETNRDFPPPIRIEQDGMLARDGVPAVPSSTGRAA